MNYEPNTKRWKRGDLVLHDADAKKPNMLMRVMGYTRNGQLCRVQYIEPEHTREIYKNDLKYLHDPARFNLDYWAGYPVLATEPKVCPICDSAEIETGMMSDSDEFDWELAEACGLQFDEQNMAAYGEHPEFVYVVEEMHCSEDECFAVLGYGRRWYLDPNTITYSADPPLTLAQQAEAARKAQEAAGQLGLFEVSS
jgi:hypothetical protein